jgi:hypothetical protein
MALTASMVACSSNQPTLPAAYNNCVPPPDASCPGLGNVAGGSSVTSDAGSAAGGSADGGPIACGTVVISTMNTMCQPCLVASCCIAGEMCSANCEAVLACTQTCQMGDTTCVQTCESGNYTPADLTAYRDLVNCLAMMCSPQCPALQE